VQTVLGNYRVLRPIVQREGDVYCFEYSNATKPAERIFVAWSPTGSGRSVQATLPIKSSDGVVYQAQRMPTLVNAAAEIKWSTSADGVKMELNESPTYLWALKRD
jgi:hypothetical protein